MFASDDFGDGKCGSWNPLFEESESVFWDYTENREVR